MGIQLKHSSNKVTLRQPFSVPKDPNNINPLTMVANLIKPLFVLFVFLVVTENSEHQFATAKSVPNFEVEPPPIRELQEVEDRCKAGGSLCFGTGRGVCCSSKCLFFFCL